MASNSNEDLTFEELFNTPWFFGEMTEENAKAILMEASENDGKTVKRMIFMKAIGQNSLALFFGSISFFKGKADFSFGENHLNFWHIGAPEAESMVIRTKPFPLKELSMAKLLDRIDLVNLETLVIPKTIKKTLRNILSTGLVSSLYMGPKRQVHAELLGRWTYVDINPLVLQTYIL